MRYKIDAIFNYIAWVFKEYKKLADQQASEGHFKILDTKKCKITKKTLFLIQFVGKNVTPTLSAKEIYDDKRILMNFSKEDIKKIVETVVREEQAVQSKDENTVKYINFDKTTKPRFFSILMGQGKNALVKKFSVSEVYDDKNLLFGLDKKSISEVSYIAGKESMLS